MGVATRGVKFKFSSGERVLCYEPDPTKAKVLYESKVLDLVVSRDERGRKVPEYLIHFFGWNSSWDRCVREEFILPFTDENRELQTRLAEDAALSIKGKRKGKLPPLIKETLGKKLCSEKKEVEVENSHSSSDFESSEDESVKEVTIDIPEVLKLQLEEDWRCIAKKNKLVRLPCRPHVVAILEAFVKHSAAKLLCAPKNGKQLMPDDIQNRLSMHKEAMDGLRVYFDFTLPHLLLYRQEKRQFYATPPQREVLKVEPPEVAAPVVVKQEPASPPQKGRPTLRNSSHPRTVPPPLKTVPPPKTETAPCNAPDVKPPPEKTVKRKRGRPSKAAPVRALRSRGRPRAAPRPKAESSRQPPKPKPPPEEPPRKPEDPGPSSEGRVTRRGKVRPPTPPPIPLRICSSASSSSSKAAGLHLLRRNAGLLRETLGWRMLPLEHYSQESPPPSLIYGTQHLLRLFVKLPELISKMNISSRKLQPLLTILDQFLEYLCEQKDQLFLPSAYVDAPK